MATSRVEVAIERPERWAKQLVSHLGRKNAPRETDRGQILTFDRGQVLVAVENDRLVFEAESADAEGLAIVEDVAGRHLRRFAQRDDLAVTWSPGS